MKLNQEQQEFFNLGVELYQLYEKEGLKNTDSFYATARMNLYKSLLALAITYDVLNENTIVQLRGLGSYVEFLNNLPENHLARTYFNEMQNLPPRLKMSIEFDFKITMQHFWNLIKEVLKEHELNKVSKNKPL
ncbi:hypothetical protein [Bacillus cereus]|uniref:hypothetical protein n=1 Tax=Bacillus cereus TaxID=1396 RepID=UPI000BFA643A|nr:hypothetical protein [Bacillus cereus]PFQ95948.1 hypothetical protein COK32_18530 [Bacillus cereus]